MNFNGAGIFTTPGIVPNINRVGIIDRKTNFHDRAVEADKKSREKTRAKLLVKYPDIDLSI